MNWVLLWKGVLLFTLFGYSLLVIIVFFGGIKNIVAMLKELSAPREEL
ncbi:MAG: hypothetical protein WBF32_13460 [Candidatus Aminicenantaceae bacterium]|jgi:hypothetical protein|nr:hypothetical protein [Candidatus Heimdallarchaeota archaeon]